MHGERFERSVAIERLERFDQKLRLFPIVDADNDDGVGDQPSVLASFI